MIDRINKLIEINLFLLFISENDTLNLKDFKDDFGNRLQNANFFAEIMQKKELINPNEEYNYQLTAHGKHIYENGGWINYLKKLNEKENKNILDELHYSEMKIENSNRKLLITSLLIVFLGILISCFYIVFEV